MDEVVKICMVGAGRVVKVHSNSLIRYISGSMLTAIVDPVQEVLNATAEELGIQNRYESLEIALAQSNFDAVVITTPTPTHKPLALMASEASKHIFLEKPMALNLTLSLHFNRT